jgi:starch synthase
MVKRTKQTSAMNIIIAAAEVAPFAKAGGLADMTYSFPVEWKKFGMNPVVFLPKYGDIDVYHWGFRPTNLTINVPMDYWTEYGFLWQGKLPNSDVPVYLIENAEYFNRSGIYGNPNEFSDNDKRFIFFSRAVFEAAKAIDFHPDIIHSHDYHTAMAMAFLKSQYGNDERFAKTAGVFTIHNLAYQGKFNPGRAMKYATFDTKEFYPLSWFEHEGCVNAMKTGIMFADKITTVSPTYAEEIKNEYFGEGLHGVLNHRAADLIGVLNGVYYNEWSPETDNFIKVKYDHNSIASKRTNKLDLLNDHGVGESENPDLPVIGMVSRLTEQKGIDIMMGVLEEALYQGKFRFALLGSGESKYVDYFNYLAWKYPGLALIHIGYNNHLSHKIISSSDFLLVPSRFEPCGLTQMYALRYGTIPIVRQTGGLADTVFEYNPETGKGNGFTFFNYNFDDLKYALDRALGVYQNEPHWSGLRKNAMLCDYSSAKSALEYLKVFNWALEKKRGS